MTGRINTTCGASDQLGLEYQYQIYWTQTICCHSDDQCEFCRKIGNSVNQVLLGANFVGQHIFAM